MAASTCSMLLQRVTFGLADPLYPLVSAAGEHGGPRGHELPHPAHGPHHTVD
jgi:hypothetical protein